MSRRIFDRRGRANWDDDTRTREDRRMQDRRSSDRRQSERRVAERRQHKESVSVEMRQGNDRRLAERRIGDRRVLVESEPPPPPTGPLIKEILGEPTGGVLGIPATFTFRQAMNFLAGHNIGLAVVLDENGKMAGVLSERDVNRIIAENGEQGLSMEIDKYITRNVFTCSSQDSIKEVLLAMDSRKIRHVPVVNDGLLVSMLSVTDIVRYLASREDS